MFCRVNIEVEITFTHGIRHGKLYLSCCWRRRIQKQQDG
jgi:hypothetical protein